MIRRPERVCGSAFWKVPAGVSLPFSMASSYSCGLSCACSFPLFPIVVAVVVVVNYKNDYCEDYALALPTFYALFGFVLVAACCCFKSVCLFVVWSVFGGSALANRKQRSMILLICRNARRAIRAGASERSG